MTDAPLSPCVQLCAIDPRSGLCVSCFRRRDEIARWGAMEDDERRSIMAALPARAGQLRKRRGGRRGRITSGDG